MKISIVVCIFTLIAHAAHAQKHDYIWVAGDNNSLTDTTRGGSVIDFNHFPAKVYYNYRELNMFVCNSSICDTAGNLMFYTNGCDIAGADDVIIENGEGINPGQVHQIKCDQENIGYTSGYQSSIILPLLGSDHLYYLFHKRIIYTSNPFSVKTDKLLYTIVDMAENNGKGKVLAKNMELMSDSLSYGEMAAVKHANGKDWWLVTPKDASNTFYVFLFTDQGITDTLIQTIGDQPPAIASGGIQIYFSPDGNSLFRSVPKGSVLSYQFDRSSGILSDFAPIAVNYGNWLPVTTGGAVSPNGRFLYLTTELRVYQFDLWSDNISASQKLVAEWDGFKDPVGTLFGNCQLAPDCKIYISTIDAKYYHVINNPDEEGVNCDVSQHSFIFPTPTGASIPSFPNYRLGPLDNPGLPCSATVGSQQVAATPEGFLRVYPNPASSQLTVEYSLSASYGAVLQIHNSLGQVVKTTDLVNDQNKIQVSLDGLPAGTYWYTLHTNQTRSGKILVVR